MDAKSAIGSQAMTDYSGDAFLRSLDEEAESEGAPPQGNRDGKPNDLDNEFRELELIRFADIQPRLDGRPLVKEFLEGEQISLWSGATGCGKTFLMLDLSLHIAAGLDWFGRRVEQGLVVYVAAEAGRSIENRVAAFKHAHGFKGRDIPFVAVTSPVDLCHANAGDVDRLLGAVNQAADGHSMVLMVIDTVSRTLAGGNENATDDMGAFVRSMDRLRAELHCHVAAVHHWGKDHSRGSRGHSLLGCAVDTEIEVVRDHVTGISTATAIKQRDGATDGQVAFRLVQIELGKNQDGEPVTSCIVDPVIATTPPQTPQPRPPLSPAAKRALELLTDAIARQGQIPPASNHIPTNKACVAESLWRSYCYQGAISGSDRPNAKQRAFKRAAEILLAKGYIGKWGDLVWIVAS